MMKKLLQLGFMAALLAFTVLAIPATNTRVAHAAAAATVPILGVASAHTTSTALAAATCYNTSCDGKNPQSKGCDSDAVNVHTATSSDLGGGLKATVYLRLSGSCQAVWAKVVFNKPMPKNHFGLATIKRNDGKSYSCTDEGGNGLVGTTQTSCYSAMVGDAGSRTSFAIAKYAYTDEFTTVATTASV